MIRSTGTKHVGLQLANSFGTAGNMSWALAGACNSTEAHIVRYVDITTNPILAFLLVVGEHLLLLNLRLAI